MSTNKNMGLGKGFDVLIPQNFDASILMDEQERVQKIVVDELVPNPHQPRTTFDGEALEQLSDSIKMYGILQPLVVTPGEQGGYVIVAGERRWRAAKLAGLKKVPAIVRTTKELERLEMAIVENVQRVDLSPLEQALSIERLHQQFSMTYDAIAKRLGKANSTVNNIVRLLQLPEAAAQALRDQKITEGHARAILALKGFSEKQADLLASIIKHGWSVRQAERYVVSIRDGFHEKNATQARMSAETPETKRLSEKFGVPVRIRRMARGGKLELSFVSDEQLANLLERLA